MLKRMLSDSFVAALIAGGLALPIVGFYTVPGQGGGLAIETRIVEVGLAALLVFFGRLGFAAIRERWVHSALIGGILVAAIDLVAAWPSPLLRVIAVAGGLVIALRAAIDLVSGPVGSRSRAVAASAKQGALRRLRPYFGLALGVFAFALPFLPFADRRFVDVAILVLTYVILGWGLNVVVGLAGLLDLGYVAFYAVGAYSYALLAKTFGLSFWICLPLAGILAAFFGILLGFPVLRLRGDYLAIVTLGFGEMVRIILINWQSFTNGPQGISGVPRPSFFGYPFTPNPPEGTTAFHQLFGLDYAPMQRIVFLYYLILLLAFATNWVTLRLRTLPIGRAWEALREDEIACRALGINPTNTKLSAFAIGAMFGGFAGAFFATRQGFISPESFSFIESAIILAIVVLGGMGSQLGVVIAAVLLIGVPEWFRELEHFRMLAFGAGMVMIMIWRPEGLISRREPTLRLAAEKHAPAP